MSCARGMHSTETGVRFDFLALRLGGKRTLTPVSEGRRPLCSWRASSIKGCAKDLDWHQSVTGSQVVRQKR